MMPLSSLLSTLPQLPVLHQLPSYTVAQARHNLARAYVEYADQVKDLRGRNYTNRLVKSVCIMSLSGASFPAQSDIATSAALLMAPMPRAVTRYRTVSCPYVAAPVPTWVLLLGACALGGTDGAPGPLSSVQVPPAWWGEEAVSDIKAYGILGKGQMMLAGLGERYDQAQRPYVAAACHLGARIVLVGLELVRLPLQLALLVIEVVPALALASLGCVVGLCVFAYAPSCDLWPEPTGAAAGR